MRGTVSAVVALSLAGFLSTVPAAAAQQASDRADRLRAMDTNGDGVITRAEWRGSDRSFAVHDWNRDGVLSGDEVRAGAHRTDGWQDAPSTADTTTFHQWTPEKFRELDRDRDGRLSRNEWQFDTETFRRIDRDRDGWVARDEFLGLAWDDDRDDRFDDLDVNRDGRVTIDEWHGASDEFVRLDRDRDGLLKRDEIITWDTTGTTGPARDSRAYQAGSDRGLRDGREAGREDRQRRNQWDLDGQRELEHADAGYAPGVGALADYQAGYHDAFVRGYREGFGSRQ